MVKTSNILNNKHANTTIPKFLGALKRYVVLEQTGELTKDDEAYLTNVEKFFDIAVTRHAYITGGVSVMEHFRKDNNQDGTSVFVSENTTEKIENPVNDTYLLVLAKNSLQKSMISKLENLTHPQSLTSIELPKTGLPIVLLLLVSMISIGFLPIKISKKR